MQAEKAAATALPRDFRNAVERGLRKRSRDIHRSWGKPGHPFSWKLDYQGILSVALRIDSLHKEMLDFAFRAGGQTQPTEGFQCWAGVAANPGVAAISYG